jgi:acetyltransferase
MDKHYLASLFSPLSIALFTKTMDSAEPLSNERLTVRHWLSQQKSQAEWHEVNMNSVGSLSDLAHQHSDLAVIDLPPADVKDALEIAGRMKCRAALIVGSGYSLQQSRSLHEQARHHGMTLLGPNSAGFQIPRLKLNASRIGPLAHTGPIGLICQSGALTASILDWAQANSVGFSNVISLGPNPSVDVAQALDYLANDYNTHSIVVYLEGISNARRFMSSLRAAAHIKPVVVLKAGRQHAGNLAAQTHSGAIVGSDEVFDAALRRAGAVRVRSFVQLFSAAKCLASRYRPVGSRLSVITNGGGPGVLAADWISEIGLQLGTLGTEKAAELAAQLLPNASLTDLIDLSEEATPDHYAAAVDAANHDPHIDGLLVLHSPKAGTDPSAVAERVAACKASTSKPLITCWMGDASMGQARTTLSSASIPTFRTPEAAVDAFGNIASFYANQQLLQQTPPPLSTLKQPDIEGARLLIETVLAERRSVLTEMESKSLLSAFHIPVTQTMQARNANEAMMIANQLGYPVALKIDSPDITHKSDVNGVALNVVNALGVRDTFKDMMESVARAQPNAQIHGVTVQKMARKKRGREIYIGVKTDKPFGPVIAFGSGGTMIELFRGHAMELPPLNQFLARSLIDRSQVAETLGDWRGASAVDIEALEQILLRVSEMVCELPQLRELDINPIIVDEDGAVAVDARIVIDHVHSQGDSQSRHYGHLAILPYPSRYKQLWPLPKGGEFTLRPIRPDDAQMLQDFIQHLSPESRYMRFVSHNKELTPTMLARMTLIDYDREMALVAIQKITERTPEGELLETEKIIGMSQYITNPDRASCEFSLVVSDAFGGQGLGSRLMLSIMEEARDKGLQEIDGLVLANNPGMLALMKKLGFESKKYEDDPDFKLVTYIL